MTAQTPTQPKPAYTIRNGEVFLGNKRVGAVGPRGDYSVTGPDGRVHTGKLGALIRDALRVRAPSGRMRVKQVVFDVVEGVVHLSGRRVGRVKVDGSFSIDLDGRPLTGNLNTTDGAVWLYAPKKGGPASRITVQGHAFVAIDGVVFEAGEAIGWLSADGRFRAVTIEGDHLEGRLDSRSQPRTARLA